MNKDNKIKICIILPAYNEEKTIEQTISSFAKSLPSAEIFIINNNSADQTKKIARECLLNKKITGEVLDEHRQGKGCAVRKAFTEINADIYVLADADMTYPAEQINELIEPIINNKADMVVGDRHKNGFYKIENKRPFHEIGNNLVKILVNKLFNSKLNDIMSGYRVFSKKFVKNYPILVDGFEIETDMTLYALDKRFRIVEIPIKYRDRPEGSYSKLNTISDGLRVISTIFRIMRYYRPLLFFNIIGIILISTGIICGLPAVIDWIRFKYVFHLPLAVLATGFEILGFLAITVGFILDSIKYQNDQRFEIRLMNF